MIGAGLGGLFGHKQDPGQAQLAQVLQIYNQAKMKQLSDLGTAQAQQQKAIGTIGTGYDKAIGQAQSLGASAKSDVIAQGQKNLAGTNIQLANRGLGNTSMLSSASRGNAYDTGRNLSGVDAQTAQILASLQAARGSAIGGAQSNLANLTMAGSGMQTGLAGNIAQTIASVQHQDPNAWINQLFQLGGTLGSAALLSSDRRVKKNIKRVGEAHGIPIYEFEYVDGRHEGRFRGVIAQDVWHVRPEAVWEHGGELWVDYARLPRECAFTCLS